MAIHALRSAARLAERENAQRIDARHATTTAAAVRDMKHLHALSILTSHHRLLYELVKTKKQIASGELWELYVATCKKHSQQPIASRTFSDYMNRLIDLSLVTAEWSVDKGRRRVFRPAEKGEE